MLSSDSEHSEEGESMDLPERELTPQWDIFLIRGANFAKSLDNELQAMNIAVDDQGTEQSKLEDMVTDIEDMEAELKGLEVNWKSLMSIESIDPVDWSKIGDKIRVNRKSIAKMKKKSTKGIRSSYRPNCR